MQGDRDLTEGCGSETAMGRVKVASPGCDADLMCWSEGGRGGIALRCGLKTGRSVYQNGMKRRKGYRSRAMRPVLDIGN